MSALSKAIMTETLCNQLKMTKSDAKLMVELIFETLKSTLASGIDVKLSGFGNFVLRDKSQRPGRNPKTGKEIPVKARRVVTFKSGHRLKAKVEEISK